MISGPSVGPALVLNILLRWPVLIVASLVSGAGAFIYQEVDVPPAFESAVTKSVTELVQKTSQLALNLSQEEFAIDFTIRKLFLGQPDSLVLNSQPEPVTSAPNVSLKSDDMK